MGGREVSNRTSENYKSKIIDVLHLDGYLLLRDSSSISMTPDLVFKKPFTEGETEIWVESKYANVSLHDKDFLTEIARYFISYMEKGADEKFDLYVFVRKCQNWTGWRHLFSSRLYREEEALAFYQELLEKAKLREEEREKIAHYHFGDFEEFLTDCFVHQVNYDGLLMKIEQWKKGNRRVKASEFYTREIEPLRSKEEVIGNFAEIIDLPENVYIADLKMSTRSEEMFREIPRHRPYWLKWGQIFSLFPLEDYDASLRKFIDVDSLYSRDFSMWISDSYKHRGIAQILMKRYVLERGVDVGCSYREYKGSNLFFEHENLDEELQQFQDKQVSRVFSYADPPFVKHNAIAVSVKGYGHRNYLFLSAKNLFTEDGRTLIKGKRVMRLHEIFSPSKYETNYSVFRDLLWWFRLLGTDREKSDYQAFRTTGLTSLMMSVRPPRNSTERDRQTKTERLDRYNGF